MPSDKKVFEMLSNVFTSTVRPEDVKYIRYRKSGKRLVMIDVDGQLGHMYVKTSEGDHEDIEMDRDELIAWLEARGAKKVPPQKRRKKHLPLYD